MLDPTKGARWSPLEEITGAIINRNESDGSLAFMKDGHVAGKL